MFCFVDRNRVNRAYLFIVSVSKMCFLVNWSLSLNDMNKKKEKKICLY